MPLPVIETAQQAAALLEEIDRASAVLRYRMTGSYDEAPWGRAAYSAAPSPLLPKSVNGLPAMIVMHYTASPSVASTVNWFCKASLNSQRAAHYAVAQDKQTYFTSEEWRAYPLLAQLPALPVTCRSAVRPAVHATWTNGVSIGIELVNLGCDTASPQARARPVKAACGRVWECYPDAQLQTAAILAKALRLVCPAIGLDALLGHEHVQSAATPAVLEDKRDPGPLFPWTEFRTACRIATDADPSATLPAYGIDMERLGYYMRGTTQQSVRIFQYMMGLTCDGVVGPKTQAAIKNRLVDRGMAVAT